MLIVVAYCTASLHTPLLAQADAPLPPQPYSPGTPVTPTSPARPASWPGSDVPIAYPQTSAPQQYPYALAPGATAPANAAAPQAQNGAGFSAQPGVNQAPYGQAPNARFTGGEAAGAVLPGAPATNPPPAPVWTAPDLKNLTGAEIIARVGTELVLAHEVLYFVNEILASKSDEIPPEQMDPTREYLLKRYLVKIIETKLLVAEARRMIPADNMPKLEGRVKESFDKERLPKMLEAYKAKSRTELDAMLRQRGTSLEAQRRMYFEGSMAAQWTQQQKKDDGEVTHADMVAYYRDHIADYETQGKARWEQLTARFDRFDSKAQAYQALATWGNQVWSGKPFAEVAKANSQEFAASDGGVHDWTTKGSLVSTILDDAVFALPIGQLSQIIEDDRSFHIVRVIERKETNRKPFIEAQKDIKVEIKKQRSDAQTKNYLVKLREKTPVWTIFDGTPPDQIGSLPAKPGTLER